MTLYKSIVFWPFPENITMLTFPIWRVADKDCNLVIESSLDRLKETYELLDFWGFRHCKTFMRWGKVKTYFVVGAKGDPPEIPFGKTTRTPYRALSTLPGPRLSVNSDYYKPGWTNWREDFYNIEDVYRYPIRKDFINIDPQVLFISYMIQKAVNTEKRWRWQIGDCINLLVNMYLMPKTVLEYVSQQTGISVSLLNSMASVARRVPEEKRDYGRSWNSYRQELHMWSRSYAERTERSTSSRMGRRRTRKTNPDVSI